MGIACECSDDFDYYVDKPFATELKTSRRKRCTSCKVLIDIGEDCLSFPSWRRPRSDIEERIHGDEVPLANVYMCEKCGNIYESLSELGFCVDLDEPMKYALSEYHEFVRESQVPAKQRGKE